MLRRAYWEWVMTIQRTISLAALVLFSWVNHAEAQFSSSTSTTSGSRSTGGVGGIAAPQRSTTPSSPSVRPSSSIGAVTDPSRGTPSSSSAGSSLRSVGTIAAPPPPSTTPSSPLIGTPLNQLNQGNTLLTAPIVSLPPAPTTNTTQTSGGSSGIQLQGGGSDTLEGCIGFWDRATHMTKAEWKVACQRSIVHREEVKKSIQKGR